MDIPMSNVGDGTVGTLLPVTDYEPMANKIMPDLGYEIEDFKYNTWRVTNWRHLEKRITGPEFEAGNWKWRILLFPSGNNNQDTVSIYLDFVDPKGAPAGWHSCVQFALVLWNPEDPTQYIYHHAHHRFTAEESDWGFTRFYDLRKLLTPCENRTLALIENDSTNITVFVRVLKDPTGVLWHNFNNYDSKKETGYVGLKTQGATGYINSLLQSLYCTTYFRKAVYKIPTEDDEPIKSVSLALQRVFYQLQTSNTPVMTTELTKSFGWDSIDSSMQHDVQEFNRVLQDNLEGKMKGTKADGAITKLFVGKMKSYTKCVNVDYESSRVEDFYDIQLNVKGCKTLRDSFKDYIQEEILKGYNKYQATGYGLQDAKKGVIFESFPPVLHLQLKRFEYDLQRDAMVKINDRHEFPMEIDLEEFLSEDTDKTNPHKYLLHGVLVHSGDSHEGHYFALFKPEKDGKWFKFDDDRVTPVIDKEVFEDNYGGEYPNANTITTLSAAKNRKWFTNAYMLVYIRESNVDEILSPVVPEDIPEHLQKRLEQERAIENQRRKEMEERHLYLIVKVVTAEKFKVHQGFDLANFDDRQYPLSDVYVYKILKSDTYRSFKEIVSRIFNIPPEQVRFWIFVNRQNKTIRLDAPISESYIDTSMGEIHAKMTSRQNEMKLYMEVAEIPLSGLTWFPANHMMVLMVFIKYFDPDKQAFEGLGHLYVQKSGKVGDITRVLCEKKNFSPDTPLKIYEEIKPNMIEEVKLKSTFQQSEIDDGDIICFQKALTEKEIQEHTIFCRYWDIPHFYESLTLRIVVSFKPKLKDRDPKPEFDLVLNKKWTYDQVAGAVGTHLATDPLKLRFTTAHSISGTPKNVIKQTTIQTLSEMLQTAYLSPPAHVLFYEMLKISIVELETKKFIKVYWLGNTVKNKEAIELGLPKDAVVNDIIEEISKHEKVTSSSPNSRIRLFKVHHNKIQKEYTGTEPIDRIQEQATLYAEEIPQDEIHADRNDRTIQVYHFTKNPICVHGIPFKFVIKNGETLENTKVRLRHRLGMSKIEFLKVKIAIVPGTSYAKPKYLKDDDIILSEKKLSNKECLGLDHLDKSRTEKVIFIRG
ncbi:ubiquitin carboxyl-terminal hydrolase 5 [Rhizophagus irregularis DAOM 181602=DAOM 197198]|uniref:ubiquitinyl hydrolase 1 n=3 Tax=Rhizophagus irregularis TaxID=588596 RepID=A0A2P4PN87_RHIID|nr:ubiquitin carboxyl-terminal hydrolase 5 [Rhizophagus irregularis DAOM 181602=DAOM 197198]POG66834.1 ubiquitin carboxyl-terminal hydrolase 5 [Rhizophagus irregularis DAOM 181602=DAOM 197198]|eukprot:XP_025173700.1 ubiquitin carboxyl-terminal hydrolase 5 [Rhizophagus irregularis DAOM 181602=DAOM 197198]